MLDEAIGQNPLVTRGADRSLLALIDDLEQQAEGLALVERELEVADRSRAEYAAVTLASRMHGALDRRVRVTTLGGFGVEGALSRTGSDWLLVTDDLGREWVLPLAGLATVRGVSARSVPDVALGVLRRLSLRSVLRRLADESASCALHLIDGARVEGRLLRLGHDFAELALAGMGGPDGYDVVPLGAIAAATFN